MNGSDRLHLEFAFYEKTCQRLKKGLDPNFHSHQVTFVTQMYSLSAIKSIYTSKDACKCIYPEVTVLRLIDSFIPHTTLIVTLSSYQEEILKKEW